MPYSYAYPGPEEFKDRTVEPNEAWFDDRLGEFLLSYDAVRRSSDPETALLGFLESTYVAAADTGNWPRRDLECEPGRLRSPRRV